MTFNPRQETLDFRIWAFCQPHEWNVTAGQIAEGLGVTVQAVTHALSRKGWNARIRTTHKEMSSINPYMFNVGFDKNTMNMG